MKDKELRDNFYDQVFFENFNGPFMAQYGNKDLKRYVTTKVWCDIYYGLTQHVSKSNIRVTLYQNLK